MVRKPSHWTICPLDKGGCGKKVGLQRRFDMQVPQEKQPFVIASHKVDGAVCRLSRSRVEKEMINPVSA